MYYDFNLLKMQFSVFICIVNDTILFTSSKLLHMLSPTFCFIKPQQVSAACIKKNSFVSASRLKINKDWLKYLFIYNYYCTYIKTVCGR